MFARGWALDHIIPDPPSVHARARVFGADSPPPQIDNSNDDWVWRQQDQDNLQQSLNQQNENNIQQQSMDQFDQQQQIINNSRLSD